MIKIKIKPGTVKKIVMIVFVLLVISYVIFVIWRSSFTQIKSVEAGRTTVYDTIETNAYIIRGETYIKYDKEGVISYTASDGDKISKGETVANVFSNSNLSGKKHELDELEKKLASLEQLEKNIGTFSQSPDDIDGTIDSLLCQSNISLINKDIALADENVQNIVYCINERQLITGKTNSYSSSINEIKSRINAIKKADASIQKVTSVNAPVSGYFSARTDGFEGAFDISKLGSLMPGSLDDDKIKAKNVDENVIGKIVDKVYWYLAMEVSADDAVRVKNANYLEVNIPVVSNKNIAVEIESINQKDRQSDAVVILKGTYMNPQMTNIRKENISLILDDFTGIYVPKSAVHEETLKFYETDENGENGKTVEKTVSGVYIRRGNEISFRQIIPIYSGEDYIISSIDQGDEPISYESSLLQIYDQIVTEGANLYAGKIVQRNS